MDNWPVKDLRDFDLGVGYSLDNLAMSVAQAQTGIPIMLTEKEPNGREKRTLDADDRSQVVYFMTEWAPAHGLGDAYGVPDRLYAGAYKTDEPIPT